MQRVVVIVGLGALLAGCATAPEIRTPALPASAFVPASAVEPVTGPSSNGCDLWLDPVTKNTDIVRIFYNLEASGQDGAAQPALRAAAAVEMERAALDRATGVDKIVLTLPLASTYDAEKGAAHIPTDPLQGDSIFVDPVAHAATNTLANYTLATDPTAAVNLASYPAADAVGPPSQDRVSKGFRYGVALLDLDPRRGGQWASAKGSLDVPLTQEQAHKGYGRLSVKIVADLVPPGRLTGKENHAATPVSGGWEVDLRYLAARTVCAAIVTASDGETVKRLR